MSAEMPDFVHAPSWSFVRGGFVGLPDRRYGLESQPGSCADDHGICKRAGVESGDQRPGSSVRQRQGQHSVADPGADSGCCPLFAKTQSHSDVTSA